MISAECGEGYRCVFANEGDVEGTCEPYDETEPPDFGSTGWGVQFLRDSDILFVVDNSGGMAWVQSRLAAGIGALANELDRADLNYRIGITTTDNGNPMCSGTTPEQGALQTQSCLDRLDAFDPGTPILPAPEACTDHCSLQDLETTPTTTAEDPTARPRPWLERNEGALNLGQGTSAAEALACLLPQGLDGCGFEAPLESMYRATERIMDPDDPAFGFMRERTPLTVVVVTDEVDCSHSPAWDQIFLPEGDRVFWSDPEADLPTSAVCWNAGVHCEGGPGTYDTCNPTDKDETGNETDEPWTAVLHPVSRYVDLLQDIENNMKMSVPGLEVQVFVLTGVPITWPDDPIPYADAQDPDLQIDFGIGPGCESQDGAALPPVRLRDFADWFAVGGEAGLFSACADDYGPALSAIGRAVAENTRSGCVSTCVADTVPETPLLDPECNVWEEVFTGEAMEDHDLPECVLTCAGTPCADLDQADGWRLPGNEADTCYLLLVDDEQASATALDDLPADCADEGWNLGVVIHRRPFAPIDEGRHPLMSCRPSMNKEVDCPLL